MNRQSNHQNNRRQNSEYTANRRRKLFKNPDKAKICGVCAGLAEYFDFETWLVRLVAVSFFLFSGGSAVIAYFVACFIMDPKPGSQSNKGCFGNEKRRNKSKQSESQERQYTASVKDVWKKGRAPAQTLKNLEVTFENMENKLQSMESFVTSNKFQLEKEFERMG